MNKKLSVALIGAGSMGGALLRGWINNDIIDVAGSAIFDPALPDWVRSEATARGIALNPPRDEREVDALVFAVKPQAVGAVLPAFERLAKSSLTISVMAGKSIAAIGSALGGATKIVRAMPNLPAAVGAGAIGLFAPPAVGADGRRVAERLMAAVGEAIWVDSETAIDAVTAVSGSGPAYFFLLAEALEEAARSQGLSDDAARRLARATLVGAGAFAASDPRRIDDLRRAVTSPGGTTQAALKIFDGDDHRMRKLVREAVAAAARRAGELTG